MKSTRLLHTVCAWAQLAGAVATIVVLLTVAVSAQQQGTISGRVVTEDGGGLADVTVYLNSYNSTGGGATRRTTTTDEEGNFQFNNLPPRAYSVSAASARGWVFALRPAAEPNARRVHRLGEHVTLTLIRGGVITGRVTNASGDPVIGIPVSAILVRDSEGNKVNFGGLNRMTDDRGVYRLYGLRPGTYLVMAGGNPNSNVYMFSNSPYRGEAPTYHPSATRDTATEVNVTSGGETAGIDIRYRGEPGRVISGKIAGVNLSDPSSYGASVSLLHATTGALLGVAYVSPNDSGFIIQGVTDGEYELTAGRGGPEPGDALRSEPRRVTVKGADVTGIELRLLPLAAIAGRIALAPSPPVCGAKNNPAWPKWEEAVISARRAERPDNAASRFGQFSSATLVPNEQGEFTLGGLAPGRYRFELNLPHKNWFVKSITAPAAGVGKRPAASVAVYDVGRHAVALKAGEKLAGVIATVADGAASLSGKVVAGSEGAKLPPRLRVYLVPAEVTAAEEVLRYGETLVRADGSFTFVNLAPGKYWLLARVVGDDEPIDRPALPAAWDADERAKLRREAEANKLEVELKACDHKTDQLVRYTPNPARL